jgi:beta-barrel assembly-enhancing protease
MKRWKRFAGIAFVLLLSVLQLAAQGPSVVLDSEIRSGAVVVRLSAEEEKLLQKFIASKPRSEGRGFNLYSREDERMMGDDAAAEINEQVKLLKEESVTAYLEGVARKLALRSGAKEIEFRFKIVDSDEVNAMALPNGVVYVNSGLLIATQSESELAGVLAHEIAHVAARHATRAATRRGLWGAAALGMAMMGGGVGQALQPAVGIAGGGFLMKFSRDSEREADLLALGYLDAAGYDPNSFVSLLERMSVTDQAPKGRIAATFTKLNASHPGTEERVRRAQRAIELMLSAREMYVDDTSEFAEARGKIVAITHPEAAESTRPVLRHPN